MTAELPMPRMTPAEYTLWKFQDDARRKVGPFEPSAVAKRLENASQAREKAFHKQIADFLRMKGVRAVVHSRTDRKTTQAKGVADFLFVLHGVPVALEAKVGDNTLSPEQVDWLQSARMDGWTTAVVRSLEEVVRVYNIAACMERTTK